MKKKLKDWYKDISKKIRKKGNESITFMIIPHGNKKMFDLQISNFTIMFAVFTVLFVLFSSLISAKFQNNMSSEVDKLHNKDRVFLHEREIYLMKYSELLKTHNILQDILSEIYSDMQVNDLSNYINSNNELINQKAVHQLQEESKQFVQKMKLLKEKKKSSEISFSAIQKNLLLEYEKSQINTNFQYRDEVVEYRELYLKINNLISIIRSLESFVKERETVQKNMPYMWPVKNGHFTSFYGKRLSPFGLYTSFHYGVDIANGIGTPLYAAANGIVSRAVYAGGYGKHIVIQHKYGFSTLYAHMSRILVKTGDYVHKGQTIGLMGATGRVTGPHLHFEVRINGKHIDPKPYVLGY